MADTEHPLVFFPTDGEDNITIGYGYLAIIDGSPWLAISLEDARAQDLLKMIPLEKRLLEGPQDDGSGQKIFVYQKKMRRPRR